MSRRIDIRFRAPRLAGLAVLSTGLFLAGCGGDDGDVVGPGDDFGSFSVTVSGDLSLTVSGGDVIHGPGPEGTWFMSFANAEITLQISAGSGRPGPGTYALTSLDEELNVGQTVATVLLQEGPFGGQSVSGTLTIDSSSADRVSGSFTFVARDVVRGLEITVTGTFDAVGV